MDDDLKAALDDYKEQQRARRAKRLPIRTATILALRKEGFTVEQKTEYPLRVNGRLDVWPIHNRWHDIKRNKRGGAKDLAQFAHLFFKAVGGGPYRKTDSETVTKTDSSL